MTSKSHGSPDAELLERVRADLLAKYGVMLDHVQLRQVLGYRTASAFQRAIALGRLGVQVFNVPGRRGKFAFSADVAEWLWRARKDTGSDKEGSHDLDLG